MRVIIAGGGKIGLNLARTMIEKKHIVTLIERDKSKCIILANELDAEIVCGDCSTIEVLEAANTRDVDCFIAVSGNDQDNIVSSQIAKKYFDAKKVIARACDPRNLQTFRLLGIGYTVSSTEIITKLIGQEADLSNMHLLASLNKGKGAICTMNLQDNTVYHGVCLKNIKFPKGTLVISVVRDENMIIPNGDTELKFGDEVVAVCEEKAQKSLMKLLSETK